MRGVSKRYVRFVAALFLLTTLAIPVTARQHRSVWQERTIVQHLQRAKQFLIGALGRLGWPPGDEEPAPEAPESDTLVPK
jgi:hypothetical protein